MDSIASTLQLHINQAFMFFLQRKYPDRTFAISGFPSEITVDEGKDEVYEATAASLESTWIKPHERTNRNTGEVTLVEGYWKQPKQLTAMDMAVIEVNAENGGNTGLNLEAELEAFIDALSSGIISLANMNFKG